MDPTRRRPALSRHFPMLILRRYGAEPSLNRAPLSAGTLVNIIADSFVTCFFLTPGPFGSTALDPISNIKKMAHRPWTRRPTSSPDGDGVLWKRHEVTFLPVQTKLPGQEEKDSRQTPQRQPQKKKRPRFTPHRRRGSGPGGGLQKYPNGLFFSCLACSAMSRSLSRLPLCAQRLIGRDNSPGWS